MKLRRFITTILLALVAAFPARAAQNTTVMPVAGPMPMSAYSALVNAGLLSIVSNYSGATAPEVGSGPAAVQYQFWVDTSSSPAILKIYDGASWLSIGMIDASGHTWTPSGGGVASAVTNDSSVSGSTVKDALETLDAGKQPLDSDLTSWAGVTRASGFDTFAATPSSANLASLVSDETGSGSLVFSSAIREKLSADRTYYVRSDGSDSNTGLVDSSTGAFLTIQKAYDTIAANLDLGGKTVTIRLSKTGDTFTAGLSISQPWTGGGQVVLQGFDTTPSHSVISTTSADAIAITGALPGAFTVKDLKLQTTTSGNSINLSAAGLVQYGNIEFGAAAGAHLRTSAAGAFIKAISNYSVSGGGLNHMLSTNPSSITVSGVTVTVTGTPSFSASFAQASTCSVMDASSSTFSGSATGARYTASLNGVIYTGGGGANYFPGDFDGSKSGGGQYL